MTRSRLNAPTKLRLINPTQAPSRFHREVVPSRPEAIGPLNSTVGKRGVIISKMPSLSEIGGFKAI